MSEADLGNLPNETLVKAFRELDIGSLQRVRRTCKRFNKIVEEWNLIPEEPVVTNQASPQMIERSYRLLKPEEKVKVSRKWQTATFKEKYFTMEKPCLGASLQLDKDFLWCNGYNGIKAYRRKAKKGLSFRDVRYHLIASPIGGMENSINCFVVRDGVAWVGESGGRISGNKFTTRKAVFNADLNKLPLFGIISCNDVSRDLFVTGSYYGNLSVVNLTDKKQTCLNGRMHEIISATVFSNDGSKLALGMKTIMEDHLIIRDRSRVDSETGQESINIGFGVPMRSHILIKWDTPQSLWVSPPNGHPQRFDLRTLRSEQKFHGSTDLKVTCFDVDCRNTVITGEIDSKFQQPRAILWDVRQSKFIKEYFYTPENTQDNYLESITFDPEFLFMCSPQRITLLDFL